MVVEAQCLFFLTQEVFSMQKNSKAFFNLSIMLCLLLVISDAAFAQVGGLDKVNSFMDNVLGILRGASIAVVTVAIIWAGYKFLFKHADMGECAKILGGGLLIGSASEIARYMLG
jgi:type IV secretory pathway VirB2 component (pilin)